MAFFTGVQGEWKPKQIDNPDYKGKWVHPEIDNPDYSPDDKLYAYKDIGAIGFDLWQVGFYEYANVYPHKMFCLFAEWDERLNSLMLKGVWMGKNISLLILLIMWLEMSVVITESFVFL